MKVLPVVASFILSCRASISLGNEELNNFSAICASIKVWTTPKVKYEIMKNLNIFANWDVLIQIKECQVLLKKNLYVLRYDTVDMVKLLSRGEGVWQTFVDLGLDYATPIQFIGLGIKKGEFEMSEILLEFMTYLYNAFSFEFLYSNLYLV